MTWKEVRLKHVARLVAGGTPDVSTEANWSEDDGGFPWVSIGDMSNRTNVAVTARRISKAGLRAARLQLAPPGTLLFSMYASLGHTAILSESACWNQAILGIIPQADIEPRYLHYSLMAWRQRLPALARSATQDNLNAEQVGNLALLLPPLDEQRRIADFLDAETAHIDHLASLRDSQRSFVFERLFASVSSAFMIDGSVDLVRLGYLANVQTGITVDGSRSTSGEVVTRPYLRVANVQAGHLKLDSVVKITVPVRAANSSTLRPGDVLMTEGGDLDKLGRGTVWNGEIPNCLHQNHVFAVRPTDRLDPNYLALLTRSAYARMYFESTGTKSTNLASTSSSKIRDFRVPLISLERQQEVVRRLHSELREGESLLSLLDEQRRLLEERRRAVVTAAVTGELDVTTARRVS